MKIVTLVTSTMLLVGLKGFLFIGCRCHQHCNRYYRGLDNSNRVLGHIIV